MQTLPTPRLYNGTVIQRGAILARLQLGPATEAQLRVDCNAPDPRARIHELRKTHKIDTLETQQVNTDGTANWVGLYVLRVKDDRQSELPLEQQ